jgi:hypothetical protein
MFGIVILLTAFWVVSLSVDLLPAPPIPPTLTAPKGIELPDQLPRIRE